MSTSEPDGSPGGETPQDAEPLLDINGNPIPRNWNPMSVPPPDAEPPGAANRSSSADKSRPPTNGARPPSNGARPSGPRGGSAGRPAAAPRPLGAYQPPPRHSPGGGFMSGSGSPPGEEEIRYDLAGNPLAVYKSSAPPEHSPPASLHSGGPSRGGSRGKSGKNSLGGIIALVLVALIVGAGYFYYTKSQAKPPAAPSASSDSSPGSSGAGSSGGAGAKHGGAKHGAEASPFGKH